MCTGPTPDDPASIPYSRHFRPHHLPEIDHATRVFFESIKGFVFHNASTTDAETVLLLSIVRYLEPAVAALDGILNPGYPAREPDSETPHTS